MKKLIALILISAMLCCSAMAEELDFLTRCSNVIAQTENILMNGIDGTAEPVITEPLFDAYEELEANQSYIFVSADGSMQASMVANPDTGDFDYITFGTIVPEELLTVLNCVSLVPFPTGKLFESEGAWDAFGAMSIWCNYTGVEAIDAFNSGVSYEAVYDEPDDYYVQLLVVPADGYTLLQASYVFHPYSA